MNVLHKIVSPSSRPRFSSAQYWDQRYKKGGTSGGGSYGNLALFKAEVINGIIDAENIKSGLELGCGDGNNLALYKFKKYVGVDVSDAALSICRKKYENDAHKRFMQYNSAELERAEMTLSLDVLYHLVEDKIFTEYIDRLFGASDQLVLIYSSCVNYRPPVPHVRHRNFLAPVAARWPEFRIVGVTANKYPHDDISDESTNTTFADFFLYSKKS